MPGGSRSRQASPTAAIIDAQSVKSAEKGGAHIDPHGYDAGKKVKGKKRHVLVDTQGLMLHAIVTAADIQDRDGGAWLLGTLFGLYPFLLKLYADGGYQGPEFRASVRAILSQVDVEIVKRSDRAKGFVVLPKRWVVERTLAWLNRCRRLSKDWENLNHKARAFLMMASIRFMVRRLCRACARAQGLPERVHEQLVRRHLHDHIVGHISRDATEIEAREKPRRRSSDDPPPPAPSASVGVRASMKHCHPSR